ncbi:hypothetical protein RSO01_82220 [Reyranella soli]|uniref:Ribbon-helix-helix protein CopG domain-containing protein n=2 Tax=Reyranella soli TaxID=1230389 RepID=A0A512NQ27_9HYPH|nr:hypothetical protein RSO01_82220 [Reyranella soli]
MLVMAVVYAVGVHHWIVLDRFSEMDRVLTLTWPFLTATVGYCIWIARQGVMGAKDKRATTRVQLELPCRSMDRLASLKEVTEASSYAEVVRNALRLYEAIINESKAGGELLLRDKNGKTTPYKVFGA